MDPSVVAMLVVLAAASAVDVRSRRIPNLLVGFGLCLGFGLAWSLMGPAGLWFAFKGAAAGLALCLPLFLLRALGAGDTKLMMVVGSMVGAQDTFLIAMLAFAVSGVWVLVLSLGRGRLRELFSSLKTTVFALASRDAALASQMAQASVYRLPFAAAMLAGALLWLYRFY